MIDPPNSFDTSSRWVLVIGCGLYAAVFAIAAVWLRDANVGWRWLRVLVGAWFIASVVMLVLGLTAMAYRYLRAEYPRIPWWIAILMAIGAAFRLCRRF